MLRTMPTLSARAHLLYSSPQTRIIRNNSEDETTAKNVIVRPFVVLREFVVIILSLLYVCVIFDGESLFRFLCVLVKPYLR